MTYTLEQQMVRKALELMADPSHHLQRSFFPMEEVPNIKAATAEQILRQDLHCVGGALIKAGVMLGLTPREAKRAMEKVNTRFTAKYGRSIYHVNDYESCAAAVSRLRELQGEDSEQHY